MVGSTFLVDRLKLEDPFGGRVKGWYSVFSVELLMLLFVCRLVACTLNKA